MKTKSIAWALSLTLGLAALCSAAQSKPSSAGKELVLVQSAPISGPSAAQGEQMRLGASIYFAHVNAGGGVQGHKLRHVVLDEAEHAGQLPQKTRDLIEDGAVALLGYTSAAAVDRLVREKVLDAGRIALVGPMSGADELRALPNVFHVRAGQADEVERLMSYLATLGISRVAVLHSGGAAGGAGERTVASIAAKRGLKLVGNAAVDDSAAAVDRAVQVLGVANAEAIVMMAADAVCASFIAKYRAAGGNAKLLGLSSVSHAELLRLAGAKATHGMSLSQIVPIPFNTGLPLVREYQAMLYRYGPMNSQPTYAGLEAFVAAKVMVEALNRAGPQATPARVLAALEQMDRFDAGGYGVSFSKTNRAGSRFVDLTIFSQDGKLLR